MKTFSTWIIFIAFSVLIAAVLLPALWRYNLGPIHPPLPPDATSLLQFHRTLSGIDRETANMVYRKTISIALRDRDLLGLFDATNKCEKNVRQPL